MGVPRVLGGLGFVILCLGGCADLLCYFGGLMFSGVAGLVVCYSIVR